MAWKQLIRGFDMLKIFIKSVRKFDKATRFVIYVFISAQIFLTILDLVGVALLGLVGAISISGVRSGESSVLVSNALDFFQIYKFSFQIQVAILATFATFVLFLRMILSIYFSRKSLFFFATKSATLSSRLTRSLLSSDLLFLQKRSSQETVYMLSTGCNLLYVGLLASSINLVSDVILLILVSIIGVIFQPVVAILLFVLFASSSILLHLLVSKRAKRLGEDDAQFTIAANTKILESISLYREIYVHNKSKNFSADIEKLRKKSAFTQAEIAFLPNVSRYIVEITMLVSALTVSAAQFILFDVATAVSTLTLFLAAGSRLVPALLRVQQGSLNIRNAIGAAGATIEFISEIEKNEIRILHDAKTSLNIKDEIIPPKVEIRNLVFSYPGNSKATLRNINLDIEGGKNVALVGPSAAGKTTLVDVILGVILPSSGNVKISSLSPREYIHFWPNAVSYVPQQVFVANTSLRENVALGFSAEEISDDRIFWALKEAQLFDLLEQLPNGLDSVLEDNGMRISGGQRQRLGIARALYTRPSLIVLDEATSSLDAETEYLIGKSIQGLKSISTTILIAHRLSTAKNADLVCYMESGQILASGSFEEVRARISQFDNQANLMGL